MDDLEKYINKRKNKDFESTFDDGYKEFKIGATLKMARLKSGLTQEEVAKRLKTKKSAISRIENHSEDIRLSTLEKFAKAVGKQIQVNVI